MEAEVEVETVEVDSDIEDSRYKGLCDLSPFALSNDLPAQISPARRSLRNDRHVGCSHVMLVFVNLELAPRLDSKRLS